MVAMVRWGWVMVTRNQGTHQEHTLADQLGNPEPEDTLKQPRVRRDAGRQLPHPPGIEEPGGLIDQRLKRGPGEGPPPHAPKWMR